MNNLTTYCSDCVNNHTINCNDERKNSWHCPSYVKKMSPHEEHIMRIAEILAKETCITSLTKNDCLKYNDCKVCLYDWMMSLKENNNE